MRLLITNVKRELKPCCFHNKIKQMLYQLFIWRHIEKKIDECQKFIKPFCSVEVYTRDSIDYLNREYEGFISGSDMV